MAQNKKSSVYWRVYLAVAAILFIGLGVWLCILYGMLEDYEATQPKYFAEAVFDERFSNFDAEKFVNEYYDEKKDSVPKDLVVEYLKSVTDGKKLIYNMTSSKPDEGLKYIVSAVKGKESVKVGYFTIVEGKDEPYVFGNCSVYVDKSKFNASVIVEAPSDYIVKINGNEVSKDKIVEADIPTESCEFMPEGVKGITYTKYEVKYLNSDYKLEVTDIYGNPCEIAVEDGYCKVPVSYDTALEAEYAEWILEGAELYARYAQFDEKINTVYFSQVAPYFDESSDLYESIRTMDNMFVIYYDSFEFTDKSATEFVKYDDSTFSCHVQLTQKMYKNTAAGVEEYVDYIDQILYLRLVDGQYKIYRMNVI